MAFPPPRFKVVFRLYSSLPKSPFSTFFSRTLRKDKWGKVIIFIQETLYFRAKRNSLLLFPGPLFDRKSGFEDRGKSFSGPLGISTLQLTSKRLAETYPRKRQLEPLRPGTVLVVDQEFPVGSNDTGNLRGGDKGETFCFESFVICFRLVQSQTHFGPASTHSTYKNTKKILLTPRVGPSQFFNSSF